MGSDTLHELIKANVQAIDSEVLLIKKLKGFIIQQQIYNSAIKEIRTKLEILDEEFKIKHDHNPIHHMEYRLKTPESIIMKLKKKDLDISLPSIREHLWDVAGVRLICNYVDDIYRIADLLVNQDDIKLIERQDYIKNPKPNGYRSLHLIVEIPVYMAEAVELVPVEVQIRTIAMDFWASLEHQLKYKAESDIPDEIHERLKNCAETINELDAEMQSIYKEIVSSRKGKFHEKD